MKRLLGTPGLLLAGFSFLLELAPSTHPKKTTSWPSFNDARQSSGVDFRHEGSPTENKYLIETMGGGVALFDFDQDGWLDLYFVNGARLDDAAAIERLFQPKTGAYANRLYRNNRNGTFQDVTAAAGLEGRGYGMGAASGDYDSDGDADLYVTGLGRNWLYRNNGDGTFSDVTDAAGVGAAAWSSSAAFLDYDRDGDVDLYVARYVNWGFDNNPYCGDKKPGYRSYCHPNQFSGVPDLLYRNNGDGTFTDVSAAAGVAKPNGKGLGVAIADYDQDGWIDIYVANDSVQSFLFENNRSGGFAEVGLFAGVGYNSDGKTFAGMGVDFQDYDNDGYADIVATDLSNEMYMLYQNNRDKTFTDVRFSSGIGQATQLYSGWGVRFLDFDNDGWKDILTVNSHVMDNVHVYHSNLTYLQPLLLFRNLANGRFENVSSRSGSVFGIPAASRGLAVGDIDNDGDLDAVVSNINERPFVLINNKGNRSNWISIALAGQKSNRLGIGALVKVTAGGKTQYQCVSSASSYLSASDPRAHFGLGTARLVERLEIVWPSGLAQVLTGVRANQIVRVSESSGVATAD